MLIDGYFPILIFLLVAFGAAVGMVSLPFILGPSKPNKAKLSAYECGFDQMSDTRIRFDVKFYLVSILFIIFDLETALFFPWAVSLGKIGWVGFFSMLIFSIIIIVGFVYEWKKGALEWE